MNGAVSSGNASPLHVHVHVPLTVSHLYSDDSMTVHMTFSTCTSLYTVSTLMYAYIHANAVVQIQLLDIFCSNIIIAFPKACINVTFTSGLLCQLKNILARSVYQNILQEHSVKMLPINYYLI